MKKRAPAVKKGRALVPATIPHVTVMRQGPPRATKALRNAKQGAQRAIQRAQHTVAKVADKEIPVTKIAAASAGLGGSVAASGLILDRGWLSPGWAGVVLSLLGASCTAAAYYYDRPHAYWAGMGWTLGAAGIGGWSAMLNAKFKREATKAKQAQTAESRPSNGVADAEQDLDIDQSQLIADERVRELEQELAAARARLAPELELVAAAA